VWPADAGATTARLGYTTSAAVYLPAARANGAAIAIDTGEAGVYAGSPGGASHRWRLWIFHLSLQFASQRFRDRDHR